MQRGAKPSVLQLHCQTKAALTSLCFYTVLLSVWRSQPLFLKQSWSVWIKAFVITSLLKKKNCLPGIMLILHVLAHFVSDGAEVTVKSPFFFLFNFFFGSPFCSEILQLGYEICLRRNVEICFASMPSLPLPPSLSLFPPSYFASSNWPVITNLKNIADVRYDHASNVPQWAGLWSKKKNRVRPCVIPKKDAKKMRLCLHVSREDERNFRRECVCPSGYVCH